MIFTGGVNPTTIFSTSTGPFLVTVIVALMNNENPSEGHIRAARSLASLIYSCVLQGPVFARRIVEAGVLVPLLKLAPFDTKVDPKARLSRSRNVLRALLKHLIYDDVVRACQKGLCDLHVAKLQRKDLLDASRKEFRSSWKLFNAVVREHAVLLRLFGAGYAIEVGICANVSTFCTTLVASRADGVITCKLACRGVTTRSKLKKCAGCAFALYLLKILRKCGLDSS